MSHFNVLSLFDGCSGANQALERLGIKPTNYYASEIDKYAIQVTMANYPNTIQLGSVIDVDVSKLPTIHLLCGGSPCQSFSFAGKRKGMSTKDSIEILTLEHYLELKSQNFEFEGQSYLFWEYMRILNDIRKVNPDVKFLLENVMMGEKWQKILTRAIGINPIEINSALVSAQNRRRLYWTNIGAEQDGLFGDLKCMIPQPKDKGILLKDILDPEVDEKYYLRDKMLNGMLKQNPEKSFCIDASYAKGTDVNTYLEKHRRQIVVHNTMPRSSKTGKGGTGPLSRNDGKTYCLDTGQTNAIQIVTMRGRGDKGHIEQQLEKNGTQKSNSLTTVQKDNLVHIKGCDYRTDEGIRFRDNGKTGTLAAMARTDESCGQMVYTENYLQLPGYRIDNQVFYDDNKHGTLDTKPNRPKVLTQSRIRRLTPLECERLQCMADFYTAHVSDSQRYKMIGNGWTISVISYIFSYLYPNSTYVAS